MRLTQLALALGLLGRVPFAVADTTTTINAKSNWGTWDGWGTSLAWWAKKFGNRDDLADIFFSLNTTSFNSQSVPGLGMTIARYNAGACSWNSVSGESMVTSSTMMASRQMEGFWTDWSSTDISSSSWDWTVDANQRAMLSKAQSRGANHLELFSNSPMWWMCNNHNPAGADDGGDNLQTWNYNQHAVYLAAIAQYAKAHWGISFESVEPFNEPIATWWKASSGTQEGCHFEVSTQKTVISNLRTELNNRGLNSAIIAASDENTYDQAKSTFSSLGDAAVADIGRVNVHGYQYGSGSRDGLYALVAAKGKKLWNSEYGESDATGESLVSNLLLDFRWLHPTGWVYWQVLDGGGWGLIDGDNDSGTVGAVSNKYFTLAQFTRHIRPSMQILDGGADNVVAAYDAASRKLVIVAVNWGSAQYLNFELSGFSQPPVSGTKVARWRTQIGSGDRYVAYSDTTVSGTKFWSYFDTNTVQTFEVTNVVL
ncbi:Endo-beta-1,6-galactanase [Pleurostoma richardsiae]|uniref:Endo-beta-1,6-galactanase n=1 Tax=Pleurostoma richardsiae TaxID=41990 RepID=A0AA38S114_9PEZI|nr:Endo-beta-1,6-galactanase [Pleurostoma richardsiae]